MQPWLPPRPACPSAGAPSPPSSRILTLNGPRRRARGLVKDLSGTRPHRPSRRRQCGRSGSRHLAGRWLEQRAAADAHRRQFRRTDLCRSSIGRAPRSIDSPFYEKDTPVPLACGGSRQRAVLSTHASRRRGQSTDYRPDGHAANRRLLGAMVAATTGLPNAQIVWLDLDYSLVRSGSCAWAPPTSNSQPTTPRRWHRYAILTMKTAWAGCLTGSRGCFSAGSIELDEVQAADLTSALELAKAAEHPHAGHLRHADSGSAPARRAGQLHQRRQMGPHF